MQIRSAFDFFTTIFPRHMVEKEIFIYHAQVISLILFLVRTHFPLRERRNQVLYVMEISL